MENPCLRFLDGTFGRGGHTRAIIDEIENVNVVAFDRDQDAIKWGQKEFATEISQGKLVLHHANFHDFEKYIGDQLFDGVLLDLGVSSPQLDNSDRGFSFYSNGPLDMRMDQEQSLTAKEIINTWEEKSLSDIFFQLGEVRRPGRVVNAIVADRRKQEFTTTEELANLIARIEGWKKKGQHPATKYFMALRLVVNDEIEPLKDTLLRLMKRLGRGGRFFVLTFHSIEDRIVKWVFKEAVDIGKPLYKKVVIPSRDEQMSNKRSRSAKLRIFERSKE